MKGIKTAVKMDWKNLMHGYTKNLSSEMPRGTTYATNLPTEGKLCLSYHAKWSGSPLYPRTITAGGFWHIAGKDYKETQGEADIVWIADASMWNTSESWQNIPFFIYTYPVETRNIAANFTNIMLNIGDKPLPYIDSDELKASGGAISKALIVALHLIEERRAA